MVKSIEEIVKRQKAFFDTGATQRVSFRIEALKKLKNIIKKYQDELCVALQKDNNRSRYEILTSELIPVYEEIEYMLKNIKRLAKVKKAKTSILNFKAKGYIYKKPYGVVLNISSWNYPINITLIPLVGSIAAGNCTILKMSEYIPNTAIVVRKMLKEIYSDKFVIVLNGEKEQVEKLIQNGVDYIFFTGSTTVGKIIMRSAGERLIPVTLELGGKSPCVVTENADLDIAARRIAWGKFFNAGQTCVAPDYILVHESVEKEFLKKLEYYIDRFYYEDGKLKENFPQIINDISFNRLTNYIEGAKIIYGGKSYKDKKIIEPTIVDMQTCKANIMDEEVFGPIIPVVKYKSLKKVINELREKEKALAFYIFTTDKNEKNFALENLTFGCGAVNDCVCQIINTDMPFGGVGSSGMGRYHGNYSYETFCHEMSVMDKSIKMDIIGKYPDDKNRDKIMNFLIKHRY